LHPSFGFQGAFLERILFILSTSIVANKINFVNREAKEPKNRLIGDFCLLRGLAAVRTSLMKI